jgi:hypothetical protein
MSREKPGTNRHHFPALDVFPGDRLVFRLVFRFDRPERFLGVRSILVVFRGETLDGQAVG